MPVVSGGVSCAGCGALLASGATESFSPVAVDDAEAHHVISAGGDPALVVRKGPHSGERFYLDRPRLTVGRDPVSDIFLNDMTVSRAHAVLDVIGGLVSVTDDGSLNGTYVNGVRVDSANLEDGDLLQIGMFKMVFLEGGAT